MKRLLAILVIGILAGAGTAARADEMGEAILRGLVRRGIITQTDADAIRADALKEVASAHASAEAPVGAVGGAAAAGQNRTTITGYIQARATFQKNVQPSSNFLVRRARLRISHRTENGRFVLSLDGGQNNTKVRDAYFDWHITPRRNHVAGWTLRSGQFLYPFGAEIERSSADREFPELPAGWSTLFPHTRDQGFNVSRGLSRTTDFDLAITNGRSVRQAGRLQDTDNYKDLIARIHHSLNPRAEASISLYQGQQTVSGMHIDRKRWAVAAHAEDVAGGEARAEYIGARDMALNLGEGDPYGTAPARAWFASYEHPLSNSLSLAARYASFDPDTDNRFRLDGDGEIRSWGIAAIQDVDDHIRLTVAWESPKLTLYDRALQQGRSRTDDLLTLQGQYRF
ncbi:MAG TPA: porin [Armatimonadota bacterium]|jgi:hypothetical protein